MFLRLNIAVCIVLLTTSKSNAQFNTEDATHVQTCTDVSEMIPSSITLKLAFEIKQCLNLPLNSNLLLALNNLKSQLAESLRNVVFLHEVCIINRHYEEYLYTPSDEYIFSLYSDPQERRVFTWTPKGVDGKWRIVRVEEEKFHIVDVARGEYLAGTDTVTGDLRRAPTLKVAQSWINVENFIRSATWTLEPAGDFIRIKNYYYNAYLFASSGVFNPNRRKIAIWSKDDNFCPGDAKCEWKVVSC